MADEPLAAPPVVADKTGTDAPPPEETVEPALQHPPECFATSGALALAGKSPSSVVAAHVARPRDARMSEYTWASEAGDPCVRKLVYFRLYPERALPDAAELAFVFKHGHWIEREAKQELRDAGYQVVEEDRPFGDRRLKIKGRIDGKLVLYDDRHAVRPPVEIKGYSPQIWRAMNSPRDFLDHRLPYLKRVPAQLTWYLILDPTAGAEGILYAKNKLTGQPKEIIVPLDQKYALWLWRRMRVVNEHVRRKKLPPRIPYQEEVCGGCPFRATCLGDMPAGPPPMVLDPEKHAELLELLEERARLKGLTKRYEEVDDRVGEIVRGHERIVIGDWLVTGKQVAYTKPPQSAKDISYWRKDVVALRANVPEESA